MACNTHCCTFTRGEFFIRNSPGQPELCDIVCEPMLPGPFRGLGNISSALLEIDANVFGRENEFNIVAADPRIEYLGCRLTVTLNCVSKENLYRALYSDKPEPDDGSFVEEFCISNLYECDFFNFAKYGIDTDTLVVAVYDEENVLVETLVPDVDYTIDKTGIKILQDKIYAPQIVKLRLSYNFDDDGFYEVDFMTQIQGYKTIYFKGTNYDGGGDQTFDALFHRVLFPPTNQLEFISSSEFMTLTLNGVIEKQDGSWFKITKQED